MKGEKMSFKSTIATAMAVRNGNSQQNNYTKDLSFNSGSLMVIPGYMDYESEPEYIWQDDAACAFQPHTLFEVATVESRISEGLTELEILDLNKANFVRAKEICDSCPVLAECEAATTGADRKHTFRAGVYPTSLSFNSRGRPKKEKKDLDSECPKGHRDYAYDGRGKLYCMECNRIRKRERDAAARLSV